MIKRTFKPSTEYNLKTPYQKKTAGAQHQLRDGRDGISDTKTVFLDELSPFTSEAYAKLAARRKQYQNRQPRAPSEVSYREEEELIRDNIFDTHDNAYEEFGYTKDSEIFEPSHRPPLTPQGVTPELSYPSSKEHSRVGLEGYSNSHIFLQECKDENLSPNVQDSNFGQISQIQLSQNSYYNKDNIGNNSLELGKNFKPFRPSFTNLKGYTEKLKLVNAALESSESEALLDSNNFPLGDHTRELLPPKESVETNADDEDGLKSHSYGRSRYWDKMRKSGEFPNFRKKRTEEQVDEAPGVCFGGMDSLKMTVRMVNSKDFDRTRRHRLGSRSRIRDAHELDQKTEVVKSRPRTPLKSPYLTKNEKNRESRETSEDFSRVFKDANDHNTVALSTKNDTISISMEDYDSIRETPYREYLGNDTELNSNARTTQDDRVYPRPIWRRKDYESKALGGIFEKVKNNEDWAYNQDERKTIARPPLASKGLHSMTQDEALVTQNATAVTTGKKFVRSARRQGSEKTMDLMAQSFDEKEILGSCYDSFKGKAGTIEAEDSTYIIPPPEDKKENIGDTTLMEFQMMRDNLLNNRNYLEGNFEEIESLRERNIEFGFGNRPLEDLVTTNMHSINDENDFRIVNTDYSSSTPRHEEDSQSHLYPPKKSSIHNQSRNFKKAEAAGTISATPASKYPPKGYPSRPYTPIKPSRPNKYTHPQETQEISEDRIQPYQFYKNQKRRTRVDSHNNISSKASNVRRNTTMEVNSSMNLPNLTHCTEEDSYRSEDKASAKHSRVQSPGTNSVTNNPNNNTHWLAARDNTHTSDVHFEDPEMTILRKEDLSHPQGALKSNNDSYSRGRAYPRIEDCNDSQSFLMPSYRQVTRHRGTEYYEHSLSPVSGVEDVKMPPRKVARMERERDYKNDSKSSLSMINSDNRREIAYSFANNLPKELSGGANPSNSRGQLHHNQPSRELHDELSGAGGTSRTRSEIINEPSKLEDSRGNYQTEESIELYESEFGQDRSFNITSNIAKIIHNHQNGTGSGALNQSFLNESRSPVVSNYGMRNSICHRDGFPRDPGTSVYDIDGTDENLAGFARAEDELDYEENILDESLYRSNYTYGDDHRAFLQKISLGHYRDLSPQERYQTGNPGFVDYMEECREQIHLCLSILDNFGDFSEHQYVGPKYRIKILPDDGSDQDVSYLHKAGSSFSTKRKKTLILDLDETLIHAEDYRENAGYDFTIVLENANFDPPRLEKVGVFVRPYCQKFLERMSKKFRVIIFTASNQEYADKILDGIDPTHRLISDRFYRDHCTHFDDMYLKDLRIFEDMKLSDAMIIDNMICSYTLQLDNGIPIKPYYCGDVDYELKYIADQLESLKSFMKVEDFIARKFKLKAFYEALY